MDGRAKEDYLAYAQAHGQDKYVEDNFETFKKFLCRYFLDHTKDQARVNILAGKEAGVFESYRGILHKGLNISDERRLDVEARVLNPRRAKNEKIFSLRFRSGGRTRHGWWRLAMCTRMASCAWTTGEWRKRSSSK